MDTVHITQSQTGQFTASTPDTRWVVDAGVTIASDGDFCFYSNVANTELILRGTLKHTSEFGSAAVLWQPGGGVTIASDARIESSGNGVFLDADGQYAVNNGIVHGASGMVVGGAGSTVTNNNAIVGDTMSGFTFWSEGSELINAKGALIKGVYGVNTESVFAGTTRIENFGTIKGADWAFSCGDGADHIVNRGKIEGSVLLGDGANIFDTRGGTMIGDIAGGMNGDTYFIDNADIGILEAAGGGHDTLKTTVSYRLDAANEIEGITAIGGRDITLTANDIDNWVNGNSGDNTLKGAGGADWLDGRGGDDILLGGAGADHLVFKKGGADDVIKGFVSGEDTLHVENFYLDKGYDELLDHAKEVDGDLVITFGKDSVILKSMGFGDLTENDVTFTDL